MNKQEAIELLRDVAKRACYRTGRRSVHINEIVELVNQIDEPQKPVVPKFVADFYESIKDDFENKAYSLCLQYNRGNSELSSEFEEWFAWGKNEPIQTLVKMKLYGYEIEKEKLYTVEIVGVGSSKLFKNTRTNEYIFHSGKELDWFHNVKELELYTDKLTEQEIKKADERLWEFAKPVEDK